MKDHIMMHSRWEKIANLKQLEKSLGLKFPGTFTSFIKYFDEKNLQGRICSFYSNETQHYTQMTMGLFFSFMENAAKSEKNSEILKNPPLFFPAGLVPFARDQNDNLICFDYRTNQHIVDPNVVLWHKCAPHGEPSLLSTTFEIFLKSLQKQNQRSYKRDWFSKKRMRPALGFKDFQAARETIVGMENIRMSQKS